MNGDGSSHLIDSADALGNFVRVNAEEASMYRISAVSGDALASARINDAFSDDTEA